MTDFYYYFYSVSTNKKFQIEEQLIDFKLLQELDVYLSQALTEPDEKTLELLFQHADL